MVRSLVVAALAALVLSAPVEAKRAIRVFTPVDKLVRADAVVVGKVTALEKEMVTAAPAPGDPNKLSYKVAVIKVESALVGAENVTHLKVGFIPPPPARPEPPANVPGRGAPARGGFQQVNLTEGTEGLFYLTKHHGGQFYTIHPLMAPADTSAADYKDQVAFAKKAAAALAEPLKALKAEKAEDRAFAAAVLVRKYRTYPEGAGGGEFVEGKLDADESRLILKGLAGANWKPDPATGTAEAYTAFSQLGLADKDGWKYPVVKPGEDFQEKTKEAFAKWLEGAGKEYRVSKWVPKKK
jgi:hypothetical protein